MRIIQVELRFETSSGESGAVVLHPPQQGASAGGIAVEFRTSEEHHRTVADLRVSNKSDQPVRLISALFTIASGLKPRHDLRFLKQGFQSWSASIGQPVG